MLGSGDVVLLVTSLLRGLWKRTGQLGRVRWHERRQRGEARSEQRSGRASVMLPLGRPEPRCGGPSSRCSHKCRTHRSARTSIVPRAARTNVGHIASLAPPSTAVAPAPRGPLRSRKPRSRSSPHRVDRCAPGNLVPVVTPTRWPHKRRPQRVTRTTATRTAPVARMLFHVAGSMTTT